ncbi:MAG: ABC transporter ATP-binding protein [Acidobacteria bacterium]|jgi:ABC-2 type transport system ATP-binding protein|nr:ABC transporter ATP-binding protein [Acidobacteriota bacterium]
MTPDLAPKPPAVELDGLSVDLGGRPILMDLHATLGGRVIGLLGPNGAGKTTLLRTMLGFFPPTAGSANILGLSLTDQSKELRSLVGYMPENDSFIAGMTAIHFVRLMAELSGLPSEAALERAHETLFYVGLGEARYRKLGTFSTGMKQMVKLAQALVHGPQLLMLDEPTNGLDPPARKRMLDLVTDIRDGGETSILLSSHLLGDVESVCDEVLILKNGEIAASCDLQAERRANLSFVEIELQSPDDRFAAKLSELGCEIAVRDGGRLKLVLPAERNVRDLYIVARDLGVGIRRLDLKRDSLQDIFLRAMEGDHGGL